MSLLYFLIIGAVAGFLAGKFMKGQGAGLVMNLVIGIVGAVIGGFLFGLLGFEAGGLIAQLVVAFVGAVVLLWGISFLIKSNRNPQIFKNAPALFC